MAEVEETQYLGVADVIALHQHAMARLGFASAPLLHEDFLEAAIMRPRMAAYYEDADLVRQAALLAVGIVQAHAFMDGNKRTAFASLWSFLETNGMGFVGEPLDLAQQLEAIAAAGAQAREVAGEFESWLRGRVAPREPGA